MEGNRCNMNGKIKVFVFDSKKHDIDYFDKINSMYMDLEFKYIEEKLTPKTKNMVVGADVVCVFVNDSVTSEVVDFLAEKSIKMIATRSAGTNQIDIDQAKKRGIAVANVPQYSPNGVAEFAVAMLFEISKKIYLARDKIKDQDFTLDKSLLGFNVSSRTVGVISTGRIGKLFAQYLKGIGSKVIAYDAYPDKEWAEKYGIQYVNTLDEIYENSNIISLHTPLTPETQHMINQDSIHKMKQDVVIINCSRGGLIKTEDLIKGIEEGKIYGVGLDVYENEKEYFFSDWKNKDLGDSTLMKIINHPKILLTSHQAFYSEEALQQIYSTTINNIRDFFINNKESNRI